MKTGALFSMVGRLPYGWWLMLAATICGIEMGLHLAGVTQNVGGVAAALDALVQD